MYTNPAFSYKKVISICCCTGPTLNYCVSLWRNHEKSCMSPFMNLFSIVLTYPIAWILYCALKLIWPSYRITGTVSSKHSHGLIPKSDLFDFSIIFSISFKGIILGDKVVNFGFNKPFWRLYNSWPKLLTYWEKKFNE